MQVVDGVKGAGFDRPLVRTDAQERAHDRRWREETGACRPQKLIERDAGAGPRQIDRPHIMKRNAGYFVIPHW